VTDANATPPTTTDPTPPTEASAIAVPVEAPIAPSVEAPPEPPPLPLSLVEVAGDRLPTPFGSARRVWEPGQPTTSYLFLIIVSVVTLASDIASKLWAEKHLDGYPGTVEVWKTHVTLILAKNRGGAWGLLQGTSENVRRPFFLLVSVAAIAFIVTLYRRLQPRQRALRWGLPLVLGGALGNVFDRVRYGHVIDFIDVHMFWNSVEHHWPTFNVADIAICVGVGLMAIDMFTSKRPRGVGFSPVVPPAQAGEPAVNNIRVAIAAPIEPPPAPTPETPATPPDAPPDAPAPPPDAPPTPQA
jgi:signal peptidase II